MLSLFSFNGRLHLLIFICVYELIYSGRITTNVQIESHMLTYNSVVASSGHNNNNDTNLNNACNY